MHNLQQILAALLISLTGAACHTWQPYDTPRIRTEKSSTLVAWLGWDALPNDLKNCDPAYMVAIWDELVARREVDFLFKALDKTATNSFAREWIVPEVLYRIDDRKVYEQFVRRLNDKETEESYYMALYLAERGNPAALATLNRHYFQYPTSSMEWAAVVDVFGKYKYRPAASNLVESLDAASLNLAGAACNALQEIFPGSPEHFIGPPEAKNYFTKRLNEPTN